MYKKKIYYQKKYLALLFFLYVFNNQSFSQISEGFKISESDFKLNAERVYVLTNSQHLISGQQLLYSALVTKAATNLPSDASKVLYFELSNASDLPIMQWQNAIEKSVAQGSVSLPDTLSAGIYTLKAYTSWMLNNPGTFVFSTPIFIHPITESLPDEITRPVFIDENSELVSLVFNGTGLREGALNEVGIKLASPDFYDSGFLLFDNNDTLITQFETDRWGYGNLTLKPLANHSYYIRPVDSNHSFRYTLPEVISDGVWIEIIDTTNVFNIDINIIGVNAGLTCLVSSRGRILETIPVNGNQLTFNLEKQQLPKGIIAIEMLDESGNVKAAKLVFNQPKLLNQHFRIDSRNTIVWEPELPESNNSVIATTLITAEEPILPDILQPTIEEYLHFQSEFVNGINLPGGSWINASTILKSTPYSDYYWCRNRINEILYFRENKTLTLNGTISIDNTSQSLANQVIFLSSPDTLLAFKYALTDNQGRFNFILDKPWHGKRLVIQIDPFTPMEGKVNWHFLTPNPKGYIVRQTKLNVSELRPEAIKHKSDVQLVKAIFQTEPLTKAPVSLPVTVPNWQLFNIQTDIKVFPADYSELNGFSEIAANILPTVRFNKTRNRTNFAIYSPAIKEWLPNSKIFLNGIPFNDLNYIETLGTKDIQRIEVYNIPVLYGDLTFTGVMAIYTHKMHIPDSYLSQTQIKVIQFQNQVVNIYPKPLSFDGDKIPDLRQILLFNPFSGIQLPKSIKIETSDREVPYRFVVEGITIEGVPFSVDKTINSNIR